MQAVPGPTRADGGRSYRSFERELDPQLVRGNFPREGDIELFARRLAAMYDAKRGR